MSRVDREEREYYQSTLRKLIEEKQNAYEERNKVVAAIAHMINVMPFSMAKVGIAAHQGDEWDDDWRTVLVIEIDGKQITWHFHDSEKYLLVGLDKFDNYQYDGHTTEEKYQRLFEYVGIKDK